MSAFHKMAKTYPSKLVNNTKHNLANFSLLVEDDPDTFAFDGNNYRGEREGGERGHSGSSKGNFINLLQRPRKWKYDVNNGVWSKRYKNKPFVVFTLPQCANYHMIPQQGALVRVVS